MNTANNIIVATYLAYILISVNLTIWVARTLHKRGAIFLVDAFHGNKELADSVNHLLVVGFYLINIGFVSLALKTGDIINTSRAAIELLSDKMGMVLLILGALFQSLCVFEDPAQCAGESSASDADASGGAECDAECGAVKSGLRLSPFGSRFLGSGLWASGFKLLELGQWKPQLAGSAEGWRLKPEARSLYLRKEEAYGKALRALRSEVRTVLPPEELDPSAAVVDWYRRAGARIGEGAATLS